jgi:hypothetical protein
MQNDEIMEEEEKREREEREREEIFKTTREAVKILNTIRSTLETDAVERWLVRGCINEAIRILNTDKSTLERGFTEQADVRECIKKLYDVIRKKSAANYKYLPPWFYTSSPIGWDGDSEDSPPLRPSPSPIINTDQENAEEEGCS